MNGNQSLTSWWALCRREWQEHRVALGWAPLGLLCLLMLASLLAATAIPQGDEPPGPEAWLPMIWGVALPFTWLYMAAAILVLLATLIDERKDRSILFWKTMPVTDTATVLSKLFVVGGLGSLVSVGLIISGQCLGLILAGIHGYDVSLTGGKFSAFGFILTGTYSWLAGYFSQVFWLLPLWGWLLLVSSVARSLTPFWAIAMPVAAAFLEWLVFRSDHVVTSIMRHTDLRALPTHIRAHSDSPSSTPFAFYDGYLSLLAELWGSPQMLLGILTGCVFIATAIFFRGRNDEL